MWKRWENSASITIISSQLNYACVLLDTGACVPEQAHMLKVPFELIAEVYYPFQRFLHHTSFIAICCQPAQISKNQLAQQGTGMDVKRIE